MDVKDQKLTKELETWVENNPDTSLLFINKRPDDMSYELYRLARKSARKSASKILKRRCR